MTEDMEKHLETLDIQEYVELKNALERLEKNPDFKKVILNGYCKEKALGAVSMLGHPATKKNGERTNYMEELVAISNLQYFFMMVKNIGSSAEEDLKNLEEDE